MSRTRVLYVLSSLAANDLGDEVVSILGKLPRGHFEPTVAVLGGREDLRASLEALEVPQHFLGLASPVEVLRAVGIVRRVVTRVAPDIVHGFGSWGGAVAQLAASKDVAVVRSVTRPPNHETDARGRVLQLLERRARSRVSTYWVVPNEGSRGLAVRAYGAPDGHVSVVPMSVDVQAVREAVGPTTRASVRKAMGIEAHETALVVLSGFESGARMDQLLTGFALATQELAGLRLFLVGTGRYEASTRWKADELRLGDSLEFLGRCRERDPIWAAGDVAIDASPQASWSRSALIAIAAGLPTIKRQEGVGGWSEDLDEALPMISGDPERFAAEVIRVVKDPSVRDSVLRHGEAFVRTADIAKAAEALGDLYGSLVA